MVKIGIISKENGIRKSMQDFYPMIKWKHELNTEGITFKFFDSHHNKNLFDYDIVIISHRYLREKTIINNDFDDNFFILPLIEKLKKKNIRVILFDYMASSGCKFFDLIDYVDLIVKRQIFKNRELYTQEPYKTVKPYIADYSLTDEEFLEYKKNNSDIKPCSLNNLHKIELGWNIGMVDYRQFPLRRYYPISTEYLLNCIYSKPTIEPVENGERKLGTIFRGQIKDGVVTFSYQRNRLISVLKDLDSKYNCHTGPKVTLKKYAAELKQSRICVSPFGWGEVCYRDFEAAIYGCILIKPSMEHVDTWPQIYDKNITYIPINWDMSNLQQKLIDTLDNYNDLKFLAKNLQKKYSNALTDSEEFIRKMKRICDI